MGGVQLAVYGGIAFLLIIGSTIGGVIVSIISEGDNHKEHMIKSSPPPPPPSPPTLIQSIITVSEDIDTWETEWRLTCDGLDAEIFAGAPYSQAHELTSGLCTLELIDGGGDGWNGAVWSAPGWTSETYTMACCKDSYTVSFTVAS